MRDFSVSDKDIAISKARWEPEFQSFAARPGALLANSSRFPIYDQAESWLNETGLLRSHVPDNRSLLLIGDEHLAAACRTVLDPCDIPYTHIFPEAWMRWHQTEFRGNPWWWQIHSWCLNDPQRLVHLAEFKYDDPCLVPNRTYLLSISGGSQGTDTICRLIDGKLVVDDEPYSQWVDS